MEVRRLWSTLESHLLNYKRLLGIAGGNGRVLLAATAMALLASTASALPLDEASLQDIAYSFQGPELSPVGTGGGDRAAEARLRELANLLELARKGGEDLDDPSSPLQMRILELLERHQLQGRADKRASYMSLCHFKICNMGRKRTPWNMWPRSS